MIYKPNNDDPNFDIYITISTLWIDKNPLQISDDGQLNIEPSLLMGLHCYFVAIMDNQKYTFRYVAHGMHCRCITMFTFCNDNMKNEKKNKL